MPPRNAHAQLAVHVGVSRVVQGCIPAYAVSVARLKAQGMTP